MVPVMIQSWNRLTFINWRYDARYLQSHLPAGLRVDQHDGFGWVSLTPFDLQRFRLPFLPPLPWLSHFPETNLRTYVIGPEGPGIWFFSLDAARLHAVVGASSLYRLPYHWARMRIERRGTTIRYTSERKRGEGHVSAELELGPEVVRKTALQKFLVERYRLYALRNGKLATAQIDHKPWPLREARLMGLEESLRRLVNIDDMGLPALVNYSKGVTAKIGMLRECGSPSGDADTFNTAA